MCLSGIERLKYYKVQVENENKTVSDYRNITKKAQLEFAQKRVTY